MAFMGVSRFAEVIVVGLHPKPNLASPAITQSEIILFSAKGRRFISVFLGETLPEHGLVANHWRRLQPTDSIPTNRRVGPAALSPNAT